MHFVTQNHITVLENNIAETIEKNQWVKVYSHQKKQLCNYLTFVMNKLCKFAHCPCHFVKRREKFIALLAAWRVAIDTQNIFQHMHRTLYDDWNVNLNFRICVNCVG